MSVIELRDHIATEAMKVIMANTPRVNGPEDVKFIAEAAYTMANAMMDARKGVEEPPVSMPPKGWRPK